MDGGGHGHPEVGVGFKIVLGAERKEIDIVDVRILVFLLVEVGAQQEPLISRLEGDLPRKIVKLPVLNGNPLHRRRASRSRRTTRCQMDASGLGPAMMGHTSWLG
jgi:hypothetical protein